MVVVAVRAGVLVAAVEAAGQGRAVFPVGLRGAVGPVPADVREIAGVVRAVEEARAPQGRVGLAERDGLPDEVEQLAVALEQIPVHPRDLVVLAVGVVVALLGAAEFVAAQQHRHALRKEQRGHQVLLAAQAPRADRRIVRRPFLAAVVAVVVVVAVAVVLAIGQVVLLGVADEVGDGEAVVAGDVVDALEGRLAGPVVEVGAAAQARGEGAQRRGAAPEIADVVAVLAVPLAPARVRERAHLVGAGRVPGFGDDLHAAQHRIVGDLLDDGRIRQQLAVAAAREDGGEVEAEAVHAQVQHPVAQAVQDEVAHDGMVAVHRVAATGVVLVALPVLFHHVVDGVVDAAERECLAAHPAFGRVVEHHVEDDLDAGLVHLQHHFLEFADLLAALVGAGEARVGREERQRAVAPEVAQVAARAVFPQQFHFVELLRRQQFERRDAQLLQVRDLLDQPPVGARLRHARIRMRRVAAHAGLVDDRFLQRHPQGAVARPVEIIPQDDALGKPTAVLHRLAGDDALVVAPLPLTGDGQGVGIQQPLVRIERVAGGAVARAVHAVDVALARPRRRHVQVPQVAQAVPVRQQLEFLLRRLVLGAVEQQQPRARRVAAEDAEVDALFHHAGAVGHRNGSAGDHVLSFFHGKFSFSGTASRRGRNSAATARTTRRRPRATARGSRNGDGGGGVCGARARGGSACRCG